MIARRGCVRLPLLTLCLPVFQQPVRAGVRPGFTLLEVLVVVGLLVLMAGLGQVALGVASGDERRAACGHLVAMIERARAEAVVGRAPVLLGLEIPEAVESGEGVGRMALFRAEAWPAPDQGCLPVVRLGQWVEIGRGLVFCAGSRDGMGNPVDGLPWSLECSGIAGEGVRARIMVFDGAGRLVYPEGSTSVALGVAEGRYVGGRAVLRGSPSSGAVLEDWVSVGRHAGRSHWISR